MVHCLAKGVNEMLKELKTFWTRGQLVTVWDVGHRFEVTVFNGNKFAYEERYAKSFKRIRAAVNCATKLAKKFDRIAA